MLLILLNTSKRWNMQPHICQVLRQNFPLCVPTVDLQGLNTNISSLEPTRKYPSISHIKPGSFYPCQRTALTGSFSFLWWYKPALRIPSLSNFPLQRTEAAANRFPQEFTSKVQLCLSYRWKAMKGVVEKKKRRGLDFWPYIFSFVVGCLFP